MFPEHVLIWNEIKKAAPDINKSGGNPVEILLWSRGKTLVEVKRKLKGDDVEVKENPTGPDQERKERKRKIISNVYTSKSDEENTDADELDIEIGEGSKLSEMVEMEEKSLSNENQIML
jgi:hypothetical protein